MEIPNKVTEEYKSMKPLPFRFDKNEQTDDNEDTKQKWQKWSQNISEHLVKSCKVYIGNECVSKQFSNIFDSLIDTYETEGIQMFKYKLLEHELSSTEKEFEILKKRLEQHFKMDYSTLIK